MVQALIKPITFDEFIDWYPENAECRYELHRGVIVEMPKPKGEHSELGGDLILDLGSEIRRLKLPYVMPKECVIRVEGEESGYEPDVVVLDKTQLGNEPRWSKSSVIENAGASIRLVIEIVSTNWRDDYHKKFADYEAMGIGEYWIVDYLGLGGRRYIGSPKQPTLTVCNLVDGEYEVQLFRGDDRVISQVFPELNLTANQVLGLP
jgi:Uma2 family endonuclease